jgi:hypothetical protein
MTNDKLNGKTSIRCFCLTFTLFLLAAAGQAQAFRILEPADQSTLKPGQTVTVKVDQGLDTGVVQVRYHWYPEGAETLVEREDEVSSDASSANKIADERYWQRESVTGAGIVAIPALVSTADKTPPFGGELQVPRAAIGPTRLLAVADVSRGRLGTKSVFDEIVVKVVPDAELTEIDFETEVPLILGRRGQEASYGQVDSLGKIFELPVIGRFSDGVTRPISSPDTGTSYTSSNPKVLKVLAGGLLQVVGNGRTTVTATNRGKQGLLDVVVEVNDEPNEPPIAHAGDNRTVKSGAKVELNGLRSKDPEGEALFYAWSQVRGAKVALLDVNMPKASFLTPQVSEPRLFRFKLRVTDKKGADSVPAFVDVTVVP